jgi:DNA-binding CsgD family transcriptional regulator
VRRSPEEPARYSAVAPDIAVDALLLEGEQQLRRARAHADRLVARYRRQAERDQPGTIIEVVSGNRAIRQRVAQIQRGTRDEIRCLDQPPYIDLEGSIATELELLASEVSCRTIYDGVSVEQPEALPGIEQLSLAGQQARVLPLQREADLTQAAIIVHPSAPLEALGNLFEGLWQHALPLDLPATAPSRRGRSTADDQRIIALLLSGLTDEAIARQLGVSYRTAQRRIAALIERLGVHTRFQAGVQAALRETAHTKESAGPAGPASARGESGPPAPQ